MTKKYEYFVAVAETRSFSKASERLFIAQSSLSQFIKNIESDVGYQLINRKTNPITLTKEGELFLKTSYEILSIENILTNDLNRINSMNHQILTIAITRYWGGLLLPFVLKEYKKKFPHVKLNIIEGKTDFIMKKIKNNEVDIALFTPPESFVPNHNFISEILFKEEIMLAIQHVDGLDYSHQLNFNKLDFLLLKPGQKLRQISDEFFQFLNIEPRILMETENITTAYKLASVGYGVTFIPKRIHLLTTPVGNIHHLSLDQPQFWSLTCFYNQEILDYDFANYFLKLCKQNIEFIDKNEKQ